MNLGVMSNAAFQASSSEAERGRAVVSWRMRADQYDSRASVVYHVWNNEQTKRKRLRFEQFEIFEHHNFEAWRSVSCP